jgi:hypothetical protein
METLPEQRLRQLQLEDPRVTTEYRKSSSPAIHPPQSLPSNQIAMRFKQIRRMEHVTGVQV